MSANIITNPHGAFGDTNDNEWFQPAEFVAESDISNAGGRDVVAIDADGHVSQASTSASSLVVGVNVSPVEAGDTAQVAVGGVVRGVKAQGAISAGDVVIPSSTTAGAVAAGTTAGRVLGVAIAAADDDLVDLYIFRA